MVTDNLVFNGIDAVTGEYLTPSMSLESLARLARGELLDAAHLQELKRWYERIVREHLAPREGIDPKRLDQSGWGVVFASEDEHRVAALKEALKELLDLRREQAGDRYREFMGGDAYVAGESKLAFLARHGMAAGPADPDRVPYYLLLVGDPETIPYRFQYQLDVQYAVGRLHFETLDEYAHYARSVLLAETGRVRLPRRACFFGVRNPDDPATALSASELVAPLARKMTEDQAPRGWSVQLASPGETTKARLLERLGGSETPALLFTASHGIGFPNGHRLQFPRQGALLCGDWPGPLNWKGEIPGDFYLSGDDVTQEARILGLMTFHFACYGAGTPRLDDFAHQALREPAALAPRAFVARLPQRLLAHPGGGALAVIGHVERAWGYSFMWKRAGAQLAVFESTLKRLMEGHPVGSALEYFNERYAELSTELSAVLEDMKFGRKGMEVELSGLWTANNDARSYAILGDPAARLPLEVMEGRDERPTPTPVEIKDGSKSEVLASPDAKPQPWGGQALEAETPRNHITYLPLPEAPNGLSEKDPELYASWRKHVIAGFEQNEQMFKRVLDAFMRPYHTTVWMYRILFGVGICSFVLAAGLSLWTGESKFGLIFGGIGVASFLPTFLSRPLKALEQNLQFITWLGIVYNTYWTRIACMSDQQRVQADLQQATRDATLEIEKMLAKHAELKKKEAAHIA